MYTLFPMKTIISFAKYISLSLLLLLPHSTSRDPGSQERLPCNDVRNGDIFLWGQAVYIISQLLGK